MQFISYLSSHAYRLIDATANATTTTDYVYMPIRQSQIIIIITSCSKFHFPFHSIRLPIFCLFFVLSLPFIDGVRLIHNFSLTNAYFVLQFLGTQSKSH